MQRPSEHPALLHACRVRRRDPPHPRSQPDTILRSHPGGGDLPATSLRLHTCSFRRPRQSGTEGHGRAIGESPSGMQTHADITLGSDSRAEETRNTMSLLHACRSYTCTLLAVLSRSAGKVVHGVHVDRSGKVALRPYRAPFRAIFGQGYKRAAVDAWSRRLSATAPRTPCAPSRVSSAKA